MEQIQKNNRTISFIKRLFGGLMFFSSLSGFSQVVRDCGYAAVYQKRVLEIKGFSQARQAFEDSIAAHVAKRKSTGGRTADEIIRIPVVVHVIHNNADSTVIGGSNNSNISIEQIESQIRILNEDYRRKEGTRGYNTNAVGADMEIEFYLATKDPDGNATTGIVRRYNKKTTYDISSDLEEVSSLSYWPSDYYLNIWVLPEITGYLGYGQFPAASGIDGLGTYYQQFPETDGVFIAHAYFGDTGDIADLTYGYGRTATHEIGHWLGLIHTWGDEYCGTDYCDDTPAAAYANNTRYCNDMYSTCVAGQTTRNMIENYLDYSPDDCMNIFTQNQKDRVRSVLEISPRRKTLISQSTSLADTEVLTIKVYPNPITTNTLTFDATFSGLQSVRIGLTDLQGHTLYEENRSNQPSNQFSIPVNGLPSNTYILTVSTAKETSTQRVVIK
ncbi:MAG: M43 family zinc metalloprotease [Siphonobacter sp.]